MPALAKLKMGGGHTYEEWQELLHQDELMASLDRQKTQGLEYGVEDLAGLAAGEKWSDDVEEAPGDDEKAEEQLPMDPMAEQLEPLENTEEGQRSNEPRPSTTQGPAEPTTNKQVTFGDTEQASGPRRSGRERQLPLRFRDK